MIIAIAVAVTLLVFAFAWLVYRGLLLEKRIHMLEFNAKQQFDADAKVAVALKQATDLKDKVAKLESESANARREVTVLNSKQAEIEGRHKDQLEREKKARRVLLHSAQGW